MIRITKEIQYAARLVADEGWEPQADVDWQAVLRILEQHHLGPLAYYAARKTSEAIPAWMMNRLSALYLTAAIRSEQARLQILGIAQKLDEAGVPFLLLKGPVVASTVYASPPLRPYGDIDILVPPERACEAGSALLACGYRFQKSDPFARAHHHLPPLVRNGSLPVELHHDLMNRGSGLSELDGTVVWERRVETDLFGRRIQTLAPIDMLSHLCAHLVSHHRFRCDLLHLYDIYALTKDPRDLRMRTQELGTVTSALSTSIHAGVALSHLIFSMSADRRNLPFPLSQRELRIVELGLDEVLMAGKRSSHTSDDFVRVFSRRAGLLSRIGLVAKNVRRPPHGVTLGTTKGTRVVRTAAWRVIRLGRLIIRYFPTCARWVLGDRLVRATVRNRLELNRLLDR